MSLKSIVDEYTLSQRRLLNDTEKVYSRLVDALARASDELKTITDERDTLRPLSGVLKDARRINDDLRAQLRVSQQAVDTLNSELLATKEALRVAQRAVAREAARASETTWCVCDGSGQFTKRLWINDTMTQEVTETCPAESHFETVGGCVVGNSAKAPKGYSDYVNRSDDTCQCPYYVCNAKTHAAPTDPLLLEEFGARSKATKGCNDCGTCVDPKTVYDEVVRCGGTTTMDKLIAKFGEGAGRAVGLCSQGSQENSLVVFRDLVSVTSRSKATKYPTAAGGGSTGASGLHVPEPSKKPTPPAPAPAQVAHVGDSLMNQIRNDALKTLAEVPDDLLDDVLKQATDDADNIKRFASLFMKNSETQQLKDDLEKACKVQ
jgi:hypothetical protein